MIYRMIVLDLDGTLTNEKKEVTPRTHSALMKAQAMGVKVVLASGRPTYGITPLAAQLKLKDSFSPTMVEGSLTALPATRCSTKN